MKRTPDITVPPLPGTRAVVTGGSDGVGLVIARRLAAAGADVVLPVRNPDKGAAALTTIHEAHPAASVSLRTLDLSSLESVAAFTRTMRDEGDPIGILVDNAGVMTPPTRQTTADGFEMQFGTNHLGHVAVVDGLLPLLQAGRARVVHQISIAARSGEIARDDLQGERSYDGMRAYAQSKIAMGLFGLELGRVAAQRGWGITSHLAHPGVAPTSLLAARPELDRSSETVARRVIGVLSRRGILVGTAETAALPALVAATAPDVESGSFHGPRGLGHVGGRPGPQQLYAPLRDDAEARWVWTTSVDLIGAERLGLAAS
ncbi:SDR family oxidoreductase [Rhodococcoides kroppenstedtii]|uniref:SDR family oxidoreductase n=1 Tax=Rhodococcoides kroppenstedtii TaxID=293050 RepID=UPI001427A0EF|nr:SDR family oxidoreductase [Rhodococcus kroppenstedtii]NIL80386.1 Fatty acyl-CoA reductase [Rhodococcus kroppenstedtii]